MVRGVCPIMFVWVQGVSGSTVGANYWTLHKTDCTTSCDIEKVINIAHTMHTQCVTHCTVSQRWQHGRELLVSVGTFASNMIHHNLHHHFHQQLHHCLHHYLHPHLHLHLINQLHHSVHQNATVTTMGFAKKSPPYIISRHHQEFFHHHHWYHKLFTAFHIPGAQKDCGKGDPQSHCCSNIAPSNMAGFESHLNKPLSH